MCPFTLHADWWVGPWAGARSAWMCSSLASCPCCGGAERPLRRETSCKAPSERATPHLTPCTAGGHPLPALQPLAAAPYRQQHPSARHHSANITFMLLLNGLVLQVLSTGQLCYNGSGSKAHSKLLDLVNHASLESVVTWLGVAGL